MEIYVKYNPYYLKTEIKVNWKSIREEEYYKGKNIEKIIGDGIPLQTWVEPIAAHNWKGFLDEIVSNDSNVEITFEGRQIDYDDFKAAVEYQNTHRVDKKSACNLEYNFEEIFDDKKLKDNITDVITEMQKPEFKEIVNENGTKKLREAYNNIEENYNKEANKEFRIVFAGPTSTGKSTLINALVGRNILSAKDETTTSKVLKIRHNSQYGNCINLKLFNENGDQLLEHKYDNENDLKKMLKSFDHEGEDFEKNGVVGTIQLEMDLGNLYPNDDLKEAFTIELIDTPGTDSTTGNIADNEAKKHMNITKDVLKDGRDMVIFTIDGQHPDTESVSKFLDEITEENGNSHFNDRFIFVMNKCDGLTFEGDNKLSDKVKKWNQTLNKSQKILEGRKIIPRIFPVAAMPALAYKTTIICKECKGFKGCNKIEKENLLGVFEDFSNKFKRKYSRECYCLETESALPERRKIEINERLKELDKLKEENEENAAEEVYIHTGIYSLEIAIKDYIERYAYPFKVQKLVDTFKNILGEVNICCKDAYNNLKKVKDEKKKNEYRTDEAEGKKGKEDNNIQLLAQAEKEINSILEEIEQIPVGFKEIDDIRDDLDDKFFEKVRYILNGTREITDVKYEDKVNEKLLEARKIIENGVGEIDKKTKKINDEQVKKGEEISQKFKEIAQKIKDIVPPENERWLKHSVICKALYEDLSIDELGEKMKLKIVDNPIKKRKLEWYDIPGKIQRFFAPDKQLNTEEAENFAEEIHKTLHKHIKDVRNELENIKKTRDGLPDYVKKIQSEISEHRKIYEKQCEEIEKLRNNKDELDNKEKIYNDRYQITNKLQREISNITEYKEEE